MMLTSLNGHDLFNPLMQGDQILYIPSHLWEEDDFRVIVETQTWDSLPKPKWFTYPNGIQPGFVMSGPNFEGAYFCRYWRYAWDGISGYMPDLRTKSNSELTRGDSLFRFHFMSKYLIKATLDEITEGES